MKAAWTCASILCWLFLFSVNARILGMEVNDPSGLTSATDFCEGHAGHGHTQQDTFDIETDCDTRRHSLLPSDNHRISLSVNNNNEVSLFTTKYRRICVFLLPIRNREAVFAVAH